jgi:CRP/FNR family transcriptional regulator
MPMKQDNSRPGGESTLPDPLARNAGGLSPCHACPIRPLSICNALSSDEISEIEDIMTTVNLTHGQPLFDEGDPAKHRYNITSGCLSIYKLLGDGRRQIIGFLFPGDFLGLSIEDTHAYGAEAVSKTTLCRFHRRDFDDLVERHANLEKRLFGVASDELAVAQDQMVLLGRKSAKEKVVTMLLNLSRRAKRRTGSGNPIALPMTRQDIGDYLGLTTETVSRTFTQLKTSGLVTMEPENRVRINDRGALEELAEGF